MNRFQLNHMLDIVRALDIAHNPAPNAIFDLLSQGFNIWCTPQDNPGGDWTKVTKHMLAAAYSKPCEYVACVYAAWDEDVENITHLSLSASAYALQDHLPSEYASNKHLSRNGRKSIFNRSDDIAWAKNKTAWVFERAGFSCPPIIVEED